MRGEKLSERKHGVHHAPTLKAGPLGASKVCGTLTYAHTIWTRATTFGVVYEIRGEGLGFDHAA